MSIGLIVTINKFIQPTKYLRSHTSTVLCKSMDEAYNELINYLCSHFESLNIDFPLDYDEFELLWFNREYVDSKIFIYKIFTNKWIEPWDYQDIYDSVLERMLKYENDHPPNLDELYEEPDPEEIKDDKFQLQNEDIKKMIDEINIEV